MAATRLSPFVDFLKSFGSDESDSDLLSRFSRLGDEPAFAELARRHGPAVLGVCRRVLRDEHGAEDAFQATFLLLATKANSLRHPELLANWLHAVAYRTAMKLRGRLYRRRLREHPFDENAYVSPNGEPEIRPDLDSAIQRLPSKYRVPVVLCYLQGLTNAEAAERVGCPANTIATRLARARDRLRSQLTRQGLTVAVSSALIAATARNAKALGTSLPLSPNILTLMEGVRRAMFWNKIKIAVAAVALVAMAGLGVGRISYRAGAGEPPGRSTPVPSQPSRIAPPLARAPESGPSVYTHIPAVDLSEGEELTQNFLVTGADVETCRKIALSAEKYRKELAKLWLGTELSKWDRPCPITVKTDPAPDKSSATVLQFNPKFTIVRMTLQGSYKQILEDLLPHEIAHCVLADSFRKPVPRWADEGAAMQSESEPERSLQDSAVRRCLKEGKALRLSHLFSLQEYPSDIGTFYAQSSAVTRFLTAQFGPRVFLDFVREGREQSWEVAGREICKFNTVDDMELAWIAWLRKMGQTAPRRAIR